MTETILIATVFVVLLGLEWRYRLRSLRVGTALLAIGLWLFAQPSATRAARRALEMSPAERVTEIAGGEPLSEYAVGVRTMEQAVADDARMFANERLLSIGVLFWLAFSPVLRGARGDLTGKPSATDPRTAR